MKTVFTTRVKRGECTLENNYKGIMTSVKDKSKLFCIERHFKSTMVVYVNSDGIYLYTIKISEQTNKKSTEDIITHTLSKADSLEDLYKTLRVRRVYVEIHEIKTKMKNIIEFAKQIRIVN